MDQFTSLDEYFLDRSDYLLSDDCNFSDLREATNRVFDFYCKHSDSDSSLIEAKSIEIHPSKMNGSLDEKNKSLEKLVNSVSTISSEFVNEEIRKEDIVGLYLMINGSTRPVEVILPVEECNYGIYLKQFDSSRLAGLELYNLLAGDVRYNYAFNDDMIIEEKIEGKHEFEYGNKELNRIKRSSKFVRNKIKCDLISFYMGLDDIEKQDNYVVRQDGHITIIDFNVMGRNYGFETVEHIKKNTRDNLGISKEEYNQLYAFEEFLLKSRIQSNFDNIYNLVDLMETSNLGFKITPYMLGALMEAA